MISLSPSLCPTHLVSFACKFISSVKFDKSDGNRFFVGFCTSSIFHSFHFNFFPVWIALAIVWKRVLKSQNDSDRSAISDINIWQCLARMGLLGKLSDTAWMWIRLSVLLRNPIWLHVNLQSCHVECALLIDSSFRINCSQYFRL